MGGYRTNEDIQVTRGDLAITVTSIPRIIETCTVNHVPKLTASSESVKSFTGMY